MSDEYTSTTGRDSENDWYVCRDYPSDCPYIAVRPNGRNEQCPECQNQLRPYEGAVYQCGDCGREYIEKLEAAECCE